MTERNPPVDAPDFQTVLAKVGRAKQHAGWFKQVCDTFFSDSNTYELILDLDRQAQEIDVYGRFVNEPPIAYLGAVFGDILNCARAALDHLVWALSVRHQIAPPPAHPIPYDSPWRYIGFPIVLKPDDWSGAIGSRLALVDRRLHTKFRDLQPFVTNPNSPAQAWLAMLDGLWNIDKHRSIHIANLTVALEHLKVTRRADGHTLSFDFAPWGPRTVDVAAFNTQTQLARIRMREPWPQTVDEVEMERGLRASFHLDYGAPGFGRDLTWAQAHMHNAAVLAAHTFEPEFT